MQGTTLWLNEAYYCSNLGDESKLRRFQSVYNSHGCQTVGLTAPVSPATPAPLFTQRSPDMARHSVRLGFWAAFGVSQILWAESVATLPPAYWNIVDRSGLFDFEKDQLTDGVLGALSHEGSLDLSTYSFGGTSVAKRQAKECKTYPTDPEWPSQQQWKDLDDLLGGALIKTVPEASICYRNSTVSNSTQCQSLSDSWGNSTLRIEDPTSIRSVLFQGMSCMPPAFSANFLSGYQTCTVGGFPEYVVNATTVAQIQLSVNFAREHNIRLVIKNTGHDFGAKSVGKGSLSIWTHHLKDAAFYDRYEAGNFTGPAVKLAAGVQVHEAYALAKKHGITLVGGEGKVRAAQDICSIEANASESDSRPHRRLYSRRWPLTSNLYLGHGCRPRPLRRTRHG